MKTLHTFIIEDSQVIRHNLVSALEELTTARVVGFAECEDEAVAKLSDPQLACDLVIVDIVLREGTGLGVLRHESIKRPGREFVVLSNYATPEVRAKALSLGALRVLDKSHEIDALIELCDALASDGVRLLGTGTR